jgi:hypothetical protein
MDKVLHLLTQYLLEEVAEVNLLLTTEDQEEEQLEVRTMQVPVVQDREITEDSKVEEAVELEDLDNLEELALRVEDQVLLLVLLVLQPFTEVEAVERTEDQGESEVEEAAQV